MHSNNEQALGRMRGMQEVREQIRKRREERIRRLMKDARLAEQSGLAAGEGAEADWRDWRTRPTLRQFGGKLALCLLLYVAVWGVFQFESPALEPVREPIRRALTESFPFEVAAAWYDRHVGDLPALMPAFGLRKQEAEAAWAMPVAGRILRPYADTRHGVTLVTTPDEQVRASGEGLVVRVTEMPDTGLTVTIRHKEGVETVYGLLQNVSVRPNDWLASGAVIGHVTNESDGRTGKLYFAVKKDGLFVDPGDVMALD